MSSKRQNLGGKSLKTWAKWILDGNLGVSTSETKQQLRRGSKMQASQEKHQNANNPPRVKVGSLFLHFCTAHFTNLRGLMCRKGVGDVFSLRVLRVFLKGPRLVSVPRHKSFETSFAAPEDMPRAALDAIIRQEPEWLPGLQPRQMQKLRSLPLSAATFCLFLLSLSAPQNLTHPRTHNSLSAATNRSEPHFVNEPHTPKPAGQHGLQRKGGVHAMASSKLLEGTEVAVPT